MTKFDPKDSHHYEIKVAGHVSGSRVNAFEGLKLTLTPEGYTVISGLIMDQAALFGILIRIRDSGLPLVAVVRQEAQT